jgi:hypothetical protein
MLSRLRRPSPALIIAVIALVMAMVSTGYAAFKLPKNSVGTKQVKKNAITGAKVKNQTLTGKDIKLSTLGTVPSAIHANSADTIPAPEAAHLVGTAGQPGFESGSANLPSEAGIGFLPVGFYKDQEGFVHLQGVVNVGSSGALPGLIFRLPSGFRPRGSTLVIQNVFCSRFISPGCAKDKAEDEEGYAPLIIGGSGSGASGQDLTGAVVAPSESIVSLDGVSFRAES